MPEGFEDYYNFNLYDIFANLLPGSVLLLGLFLPSLGVEGLLIDFSLGSALVFLLLSFAAGLVVQACGYPIHSGAKQFDKHLSELDEEGSDHSENGEDAEDTGNAENGGDSDGDEDNREEEDENEPDDSSSTKNLAVPDAELPDSNRDEPAEDGLDSIDTEFIELIRDERDYGPQYNNWTSLYTWVLVKLDGSSRTRAIRLHGLFLATRGMFVVSLLLFIFYSLTLWLYQDGLVSIEISWIVCTSLVGVSLLLTIIFCIRTSNLNASLTNTMIKEYVVEYGS